MIATILSLLALAFTILLWIPAAGILGGLELVTTFSLSAAWEEFKSVPILIWDFVHYLIEWWEMVTKKA